MHLIIGRFQGLSTSHIKLISESDVVVIIDSGKMSKRNPFSFETRERMIRCIFGESIEIYSYNTGYLPDIIKHLETKGLEYLRSIRYIICGEDRIKGYQKQLQDQDVWFKTHSRTDGISGTAIRQCLINNDRERFFSLTHPGLHNMFDELREELVQAL